jgi:hypothetical protein
MGIPRLARLLIFSTLLITIPTLYLLYPHRESILQTTQGYLEKGGIDSSHWRDPLPPPVGIDVENGEGKMEHEEVRDWEGQDVIAKPTEAEALNGITPPIEEGPLPGEDITGNIAKDILEGGVIMPKLENATAKLVHLSYGSVLSSRSGQN